MRDIVYFDLETRHSAAEVGGWHNTAEMRLSVGVTYSTASGKYTIYSEEMVDDLIRQLSQADLVVGYNHEHFDYGVLQRYTMWNMIDITNNLDLCKDIEQRGGVRVKLDSVAAASIGSSKTAVGTQALKWWAEYAQTGNTELLMDIARYCCFDVNTVSSVMMIKRAARWNCPWIGNCNFSCRHARSAVAGFFPGAEVGLVSHLWRCCRLSPDRCRLSGNGWG